MGMAQEQSKKPADSKKSEDSSERTTAASDSGKDRDKTEKRAEKLTEKLAASLPSTKDSQTLPGSSSTGRKSAGSTSDRKSVV